MSNWFEPNVENEQQSAPEIEITDPEELAEIERVIEEHTGDGPGEEAPATSDFEGFPEPDVQDEDDEEHPK